VDDMRFAVIVDGVVANVIEAPLDWAVDVGDLVASETASPDDIWDGAEFTAAAVVDGEPTARDKYAAASSAAGRIAIIAEELGLVVETHTK
jgi:hypothetical protein